MKSAVLIHGHHLHTMDWERIEWGNPGEGVYGNIPRGLVEALRLEADTIILGTGASEKEGLKEGEFALKVAHERIREIPEFTQMTPESAAAWLESRVVLELTAQNTPEEIQKGAAIANAQGAQRLIQVACRTHAARALKTALLVLHEDESIRHFLTHWYFVASDTIYDGADVDTVVVIEPPHRPDRLAVSVNETLAEVVRHMNHPRAGELNESLKRAIAAFTQTA